MDGNDYRDLMYNCQFRWGTVGAWRGEVGNHQFTTRSGHAAALRRDAEEGFLYGAVAITNPDHPALKLDWPGRVGSFKRPVSLYQGTQKILDLPVLSQGEWFIFSCGYEGMGDLIPRWSWRDQNTYRTAEAVMDMCEDLSSLFAAMWNEFLLKRNQPAVARVKQPPPSIAELSALLDSMNLGLPSSTRATYQRCPDPLPPGRSSAQAKDGGMVVFPRGQHSAGYNPFPGKSQPLVVPPPKAPFVIEGWHTEASTVNHEVQVIDKDTVQVTVTGRNGKVLAQFNIRYDDKGAK